MRVIRFGDTYASAYIFSDINAEEEWGVSRPPVQQPVGGAGGAFDFYGNEDYPIAPMTVIRRHTIVASDYDSIGDELEDLRAALFVGLSKLFALPRGGVTHRWTWAKCVHLITNEKSGTSKNTVDVEITFNCPEGIWYGYSQTQIISSSSSFIMENAGNYPALVNISVEADTDTVTKFVFENTTNETSFTWDPIPDGGGGIPVGKSLEINSHAYSVMDSDGADEYRYTSMEDGQMAFVVLSAGNNDVSITITPPTAATVTLVHYSTY